MASTSKNPPDHNLAAVRINKHNLFQNVHLNLICEMNLDWVGKYYGFYERQIAGITKKYHLDQYLTEFDEKVEPPTTRAASTLAAYKEQRITELKKFQSYQRCEIKTDKKAANDLFAEALAYMRLYKRELMFPWSFTNAADSKAAQSFMKEEIEKSFDDPIAYCLLLDFYTFYQGILQMHLIKYEYLRDKILADSKRFKKAYELLKDVEQRIEDIREVATENYKLLVVKYNKKKEEKDELLNLLKTTLLNEDNCTLADELYKHNVLYLPYYRFLYNMHYDNVEEAANNARDFVAGFKTPEDITPKTVVSFCLCTYHHIRHTKSSQWLIMKDAVDIAFSKFRDYEENHNKSVHFEISQIECKKIEFILKLLCIDKSLWSTVFMLVDKDRGHEPIKQGEIIEANEALSKAQREFDVVKKFDETDEYCQYVGELIKKLVKLNSEAQKEMDKKTAKTQ